MDLYELVDAVAALVQQRGRVAYRSLKKQFQLDVEGFEDLKEELLFSHPAITEVDGRGLIWNGDGETPSPSDLSPNQTPVSYTPQHLAERILAEQAAMESRGSANGERKTITALFADLKGSTALIEGLDPEDARAIIDPALQLMMDAVHRYDGYVAQALGDGIFALFGAPLAHEDHPQRALYAALRMQEEMRQHSDQSRLKGGIPLQMRVGINTGEVVVRSIRKDDLHTDYVPVGHSTNLAARMEQMATPGSIVISEYTRKLTEGYFELKALGAADIKGVEEPLNVYEVLGAGPLRTRLQVSARRGLTRFVGRHSELDQLQQALEEAKAGHGQIVGVMGEPGLGKSRLFYEFKLTSQSGCLVLEAFAVSHGKASPYLPLIELLKNYFEIEPPDEERKRREKVTGKVLALDRSLEDTLPYLFSLLGIEDPESNLHQMDAQIRRQRTFAALKKLFLRESLNQPLLLIFEDLHWIDSETQGFLDTLSESVVSANLLLLVNYRPEYQHEWGHKTYYTQLQLAPLGQAEAEELLTFLLGSDESLQTLRPLILEKTEGTPFFMEEVVQTLAEEGALVGERSRYRLQQTPTELHISPTVQGVLAARIDRLAAEEKTLLQQLAVIGRQFPLGLVKQVVSQSEGDLYRVLASLQAKEFLYEQPAFPEVEYLFKHALTQDVAYGTLLQEQRKTLHERTAQAIEVLHQDRLDDHYRTLAHHYRLSGNVEKAVHYLGLAGQQAVQRSAHEAVRLLETALELLPGLSETSVRAQHELRLQVSLGSPLMLTRGMGAPEVERTYSRAIALCRQGGDTAELFSSLFGMSTCLLQQGKLQKGYQLAEQCLTIAQGQHPSILLCQAHFLLGNVLYLLGEFVTAHEHLEQGISLYDAQPSRSFFLDFGVGNSGFLAKTLQILGYSDAAQSRSNQTLRMAQDVSSPFMMAFAHYVAATVHVGRRDVGAVQRQAQAETTLCRERGFPLWLAWGTMFAGWALTQEGHGAVGLSQLKQGLTQFQATGSGAFLSQYYALLAEAYAQQGQSEAGLNVLAEALGLVGRTGERYYEAELYRLKGELTLQQSPAAAEAEACFQQAIAIAQQQAARSWELRAATSLARLWQSQGKRTEARDLLAPVYNWFTEGFDTADLKDAKALLTELSEGQ